ncbi:MAG: PHP domain-containing protein, partial [Acidimicrobiia bacterium]
MRRRRGERRSDQGHRRRRRHRPPSECRRRSPSRTRRRSPAHCARGGWGIRRSGRLLALIDLHSHSNASDGSDSPARIPELAAAAGYTAVALTDHDTLAGIPEARERAVEL